MAICHLRTSVGSASRGQSARAKVDYISREGKYAGDTEEVEHIKHGHMPGWAAEDGRGYWRAADEGERANGRLFVEVQVALPNELNKEQRRELAQSFARRLTGEESLPYTLAIHRGESKEPDKPDNPHAHIVMSERSNDGVARTGETWFRRANRREPERGGARKVSQLQEREWPQRIRQGWAAECNRALERAGREERIDPRTLAEQARAAFKNGELEQAAELSRTPEPKRGAGDAIQRRYEQGQAPEPSRAVAAWERVRAENERWRKECRKRSQKAERARAALDAAARLAPASEEEREIGQMVGKAIGRQLAKAERDEPSPSQTPGEEAPPKVSPLTWWERYRERRQQRRRKDSRRRFAEQAAGRVIQQLERGVAPWQKGWRSPREAQEPPYNPVTAARYQGLNTIVLRAEATERGYSDPRWLSYQQARKIGAQVRQGERGTQVEYWQFPPKGEAMSKDAAAGAEQEKPGIIHRTYSVFNAEQCEGLPQLVQTYPRRDWEVSERAERLLQESGVKIEHQYGDRAYYRVSEDKVVLPRQEQFRTYEAYYATALHEMGHWTGHSERLDRQTLHQGIEQGYGSQAYAREELRAEMTSMMVNGVMKLPHDPERHAAYVKSWIKALSDNPNELRRAASDADRMAAYLLQYDRERPREIEPPSRQDDYASPMPERPLSRTKELGRARSRADDLMSR